MKKLIIPVCAVLLFAACGDKEAASVLEGPVSFTSNEEKVSYAMGLAIGRDIENMLSSQGHDQTLNKELIIRGLSDAIQKREAVIHPDSCQMIVGEYLNEQSAKQRQSQLSQFEGIKAEGEKFLSENKNKKGVSTTLSGLQYEVLKAGKGASPKLGDSVEVHYRGTLLDGTQFDSSIDRNETFKFEVAYGGLIEGWIEGIQLMNPGAKFKFWLPYQLAYGDRGAGADIPPYSALVFEIELISVKPKAQ